MSAAFTWADTHISSAHCAVEGGPVHGHTWRVRAYWLDDGRDARQRWDQLWGVCSLLDHTLLPRELSRAESLAAHIGEKAGASMVEVWREAEGLGARWVR